MGQQRAGLRRLGRAMAGAVAGIVATGAVVAGAGTAGAAPGLSASLTAASQPPVLVGVAGQPAGNWTLSFGALSTWALNDTVTIGVQDHSGAGNTVTFHAAPTVTAVPAGPTFNVSLSTDHTALVIQFTNSGGPTTGTQSFDITGVAYDVAAAAAGGPVVVTAGYTPSGGSPSAITSSSASNANVVDVSVTANSPAAAAAPSAADIPIGNVVMSEAAAGGVPAGWVCVTVSAGTFDKNAAPTIAASGGGAAVAGSVSGAGTTTPTLSFDVTTPSSSGRATYTLGGLAVDAPSTAQMVTVGVHDAGTAAGCSGAPLVAQGVRAYGALASSRLFGPTADGTAAAELESQFVPGTNCPSSHAVALATDANYPDALAASFLAGYLGSGILLTPTASLSSDALTALKDEGIQYVYVVGGPIAVSDADVTQLGSTPAYNCGGSTATGSNLVVTRLSGQTLYDTAAAIAEAVGQSNVGTAAFPGAYGLYDDVGGAQSSSASTGTTAEPTAVLATGTGFQDAIAASPMAYAQAFPVLLTDPNALSPAAQAALTDLGIKQVIVMGGPVAVTDPVVAQVQGMGIEVTRIAGVDYTDTATQLAGFELNATNSQGQVIGLNWQASFGNTIELSRGDFYADGLAGCVVGGTHKQPMLLTVDPNTVSTADTQFLNEVGAIAFVLKVVVFGGTQAVADSTLQTVLVDISAG